MEGTFEQILEYYGAHDLEFDANIGDVDMDATYCFSGVLKITDYCRAKYGDLLNSKAVVKYDASGRNTDCVIVDYPNYKLGQEFTMAVAGYVSEKEYNLLFGND